MTNQPTTMNNLLKQSPPESNSWAGKVAFGFSYPIHGWIQLAIMGTAYVQSIVVSLSNVFDPFPEFVRWLNDMVGGQLPSEFEIDEEGEEKILRALPVNEDQFVFEISEVLYGEAKLQEEPIYLYVQVSRKQFLSEFIKRWDDFLENQYEPVHWEQHGTPSLRQLNVSKVRHVSLI